MNDSAFNFSAVYLMVIGLFASPLLAFGGYAAIRKKWPNATRPGAAISAAFLIVVLCAAISDFGFRDVFYDVAFLILAYTAYCFLAV